MQRFAIATAIFATLGLGAVAIASTNVDAAGHSAVNSAIAVNLPSPLFSEAHRGGGVGEHQALSTVLRAQAENEIAADGAFVPVEHAVSGGAYVETIGEATYLVLDQAFTTDSGPDLKVILYRGEATTAGDVPNQIAEDSYVTLAPIVSFAGEQRYLIPAGIRVEDYWAVSIWCRAFNVTFSYASL